MANRIVHILAIGVLVMLAWAATTQAATNWYSGHHYIQEGGSYGDVYVRNNAIVDMTGGEVARGLLSYDNSTVNVNGGEVWLVLGRGNSTVNFSGGQAYRLESEDNSTVNITGGRVKRVVSQDYGTVHMSGGQAYGQSYSSHRSTFNLSSGSLDLLYALDESTINFSGGQVNRLYASGSATINISGGRIKTNMFADGSSVINIYGYGFEYDGEVLTGYWHDHTSFSIRIVDNFSITYEHIVFHIRGEPRTLIGLEIVGPNDVAENFSASYKAVAYYENGSTRDVTDSALWVVEPNMAADIDDNGVLTTKDIVKEESATILASYTEGDVTVEAEKAIDIFPICPTGTALQFDGVDDYVDCGGSFAPVTGSATKTIMAWARLNVSDQGGRVFTLYRRSDSYTAFSIRCSGEPLHWTGMYAKGSNSHDTIDSGVAIVADTWTHIALVQDGVDVNIYVNGLLANGVSDATLPSISNPTNASIGAYIHPTSSSSYFPGLIDDVRIYDRALSAEEIRANMHRRLAGDELGLVGYWDFDEGEGQIVYDLSGNGNDGQLGSTPEADDSDPAWVESDAPIGVCSLYQIATLAADGAVERKTALLEELLAGLAGEWTAYEALEELLESGDYGVLNKGDIVTAKQKIHSATQHEEQSIDALEKSIEKLEDALSALGYEPDTAANIGENGVLTTKDIVKEESATILAGYTEGDVTIEAEKAIDILAICPTGTALQFDGVDDYVMVGDKDNLEPQELTLSFWAQLNNPSGHFQGGIAKGYVFGSPIEFSYRMDFTYGYLRAGITNTENAFFGYFGNFIPVGDNNWHMWTMTVGDSKVFIYKDGFIVGTTGYTGTIDYTKTHNNFVIGARDNGRYAFNGVMDEVAIYNRALSAEEIRANMHQRLAGDEPGLVGYWDFDEGEGQIVYDLSGNGNDGQLGVTADVDVSDPAWIESDAPIGICTPYQIATLATDGAVKRKTALLEELLVALDKEWAAYEALEELLEGGDYGDLNKGDIVTAKQKIHSAIQHEEQSIDALEKSIEKLEDALSALGYEPEAR